jgi:hypothetical protein
MVTQIERDAFNVFVAELPVACPAKNIGNINAREIHVVLQRGADFLHGYSSTALRQDLERVRTAWEDAQANRKRSAIYGYLTAVYTLVSVWAGEGREMDRARRALRLQRLAVSEREDPFAAIIRCTADPAKADKRTRSKWSRVMRYAAVYKLDSEPLEQFVRRKGGINACAGRFTRSLGRGGPVGGGALHGGYPRKQTLFSLALLTGVGQKAFDRS